MRQKRFYLIFLLSALFSCLDSPEMTTGIVNGKEKPTVLTGLADPFRNDGHLLFQGEIISAGKAEITEKGFYWSTVSNNPDINDSIILQDTDMDIFSCEMKGLRGDTVYYWRAFAKNIYGYDYGDVHSYRAPKIWEAKAPINTENNRMRGAVIANDNKIYMVCGEFSGYIQTNETWEYSISSNTWFNLKQFMGDSRINPVSFAIGNLIFVGTGRKASDVIHKDFYCYDSIEKDWKEVLVPSDFEARYEATALSYKNKGFVIGGVSSSREALNSVWQYDLTNGWEQMGDFPVKISAGIGICDDKRVFVGFGYSSETSRILWEYDDEADNWEEFSVLPDYVGKIIFSGVIIKNIIYIVDEENTIWACDMNDETKTWKEKTKLPSDLPINTRLGGDQKLLSVSNSNSIFVGLGFTRLLYEYRPLWDN